MSDPRPPIAVAVYDTKPYDRQSLQRHGASEIRWIFHEFRLNAETAGSAESAQAVCIFVNDKADRACLEKLAAAGVKLVALRCAGFNNVDLVAAKELHLPVVRVPAYSPHAVAEHAVGLLLTLNRRIHRAYNRVREHNFSLNGLVGFDLAGKTAGIVGTGRIGQMAAQILRGFQMRVLAYDPSPNQAWSNGAGVEYASFEEVLSSSDVVSLHLPLTPQTMHLLNETTLRQMKPGAYLVNTSRGKLVDTGALIQALKRGTLGGVALDVYEEEEGVFFEDLSDQLLLDDELSHLLTFPNVLITSHQAFLTQEALEEIARVTAENILHHHHQQPLLKSTLL